MAPRGGAGGGNPPPMFMTELVKTWQSWSNLLVFLQYQIIILIFSVKILLIKEFELVRSQSWPSWAGQASTLTDSSRSIFKIDQFELVKPQNWLTWASQTSKLTDLSQSNLKIDWLEPVKSQHWPTRVGQIPTLTDSSRSNLSTDRLELVKFLIPPPNRIPLEPSLSSTNAFKKILDTVTHASWIIAIVAQEH